MGRNATDRLAATHRLQTRSANGFANETGRDIEDDARHRRRSVTSLPVQRDVPGYRRRGRRAS
jgi:hypothetical protein